MSEMNGLLALALIFISMGAVIGYWFGRGSANHRLLDENRRLADELTRMERMASEQSGSSTWVFFLLAFMTALMFIWLWGAL
jgi:hypothetical protein